MVVRTDVAESPCVVFWEAAASFKAIAGAESLPAVLKSAITATINKQIKPARRLKPKNFSFFIFSRKISRVSVEVDTAKKICNNKFLQFSIIIIATYLRTIS